MALSDRTIDLIVRANIDQASQPLENVVGKINALTASLQEQKIAAEAGAGSEVAYTKTVKDLQAALQQLLTTRGLIDSLDKRQATVDKTQAVVDTRSQRVNDFQASMSAVPTDQETSALAKLNTQLDRSTAASQRAQGALLQLRATLESIGVLDASLSSDNPQRLALDRANSAISGSLLTGVSSLKDAKAGADEFTAALMRGAQAAQDQRIALQQVALAEAEAAKAALDAAKVQQAQMEAADLAAHNKQTILTQANRGIDQFVAEQTGAQTAAQAKAQADADAKAAADAQAQREAADLAAHNKQTTLTQANRGIDQFVAQQQAEAIAAQIKAQEDLAKAAQQAADASVLAAQREADAQQKAADQIRAAIASAQKAADQGVIGNAARAPSGGAPLATVSQATTPEAAQARLATLPGPGTGNLASLQAEVARLQEAMSAGGDAVKQYGAQFQLLDATVKQLELDLGAAITQAEKAQSEIISAVAKPSAASTQTASQQIGGILAARGSAAPISDTSDAIDKVEASLSKGTLTAESYNKVMDQIFAVQRQIASDASLIDAFQRQETAVTAAQAAYTKANAALATMITAAKNGTASIQDLQSAEARLSGAAGNLSQQVAQQTAITAQLKERKIDTADLTTETATLVAETQRLAAAQNSAKGSSGGLFGLSAYQFQNLQFQINDVITQLSLGQGVLRTFEAQGGQIFQIFDLSITQLKQLAIVGIPAAAALGLVALALERVFQTASAGRSIDAILSGSTIGAGQSTASLVALERELERTGIAFADAQTAVQTFLKDGLDDSRIKQFAITARNLSQGLGTDFGTAIKALSAIPSASADDLEKLLIEYQALTPELAAYIVQQQQAGNIELARAATLDALTARAQAMRNQGVGPLKDSVIDLTNAWHGLLDALGSSAVLQGILDTLKDVLIGVTAIITGIETAAKKLNDLGDGLPAKAVKIAANYAVNQIPFVGPARDAAALSTAAPLSQQFDDANKKVITLQDQLDKTKNLISDFSKDHPDLASTMLAGLKQQAVDLEAALKGAIEAQATLAGKLTAAGTAPGSVPSQFGNLPAPVSAVVNKQIPADLVPVIANAAAIAGVSIPDLSALYRQEAVRNPDGSFQTSSAGAKGPLQLEPGTFQEMLDQNKALFEQLAAKIGQPLDKDAINNPNFNTLAGALYFKQQTAANQNNPALGAAAYNAGPGALQAVLDGQKQLPAETAQYVSNFMARPGQGGNNFRPPTSGLSAGGAVQQQAETDIAVAAIQREIADAQVNPELRGTSDAKVAQDNTIATQHLTDAIIQFQKDHPNVPLGTPDQPTAARNALTQQNDVFRGQQAAQRAREQADIEQTAESLQNSNTNRVAAADPSNVTAKQQQAFTAFNSELDQIDKLIVEGVAKIKGVPIEEFRQGVLAERDKAVVAAGYLADIIGVTDSVKEQQTAVSTVTDKLKANQITMAEAFDEVAAIIARSGPKIKAAADRSNADIAGQPSSPKNDAQLAANAKALADANGQAANSSLDTAAMQRINDLIKARGDEIAATDFQLKNYQISQQQADAQDTASYTKYNAQLTSNIGLLRDKINAQHDSGALDDATYAKLISELTEATTKSQALTKSQQQFEQQLGGVISSGALKAFETIGTSIGGLINGTSTWLGVLKSVGTAFEQFVADVLKGLAEIIIKQELANAEAAAFAAYNQNHSITGALSAGFGSLFGGGAAAAGTGASAGVEQGVFDLAHGGAIVGSATMRRQIDASVFVGARRMHTGGIAGLSSNEVPTILQKGETVRTTAQEQALQLVNGMKGQSAAPQSIRNVIVFDPEQIPNAMANAAGEKVVLQMIRKNGPAISQLLGRR